MRFWQTVHWFYTSLCNEKCRFCFKPVFADETDKSRTLAEKLVKGKIKKAVITGGEPLLLGNLEAGLKILNEAGIDTIIHTNATLLNEGRIKSLVGLVDEIAVPIDSMNRNLQEYLRGKDCLLQVKRALKQLEDKDVRIGIHTVATSLNIKDIPEIYRFIKQHRFDYWKIYEFNPYLIKERFGNIDRFGEIEELNGPYPTESDGGVYSLFADFLLMEEKFQHDKRVKFVGVNDYNRTPYFFLGPNGEVFVAFWFLQGKRSLIGNILEEGFDVVKKKAVDAYNEGVLFDEEAFIETRANQPLWARVAWEGNYFPEELEDVEPEYQERFFYLSNLYLNRLKKQGDAPLDAELTYIYSR